jgi:hypothetical protein
VSPGRIAPGPGFPTTIGGRCFHQDSAKGTKVVALALTGNASATVVVAVVVWRVNKDKTDQTRDPSEEKVCVCEVGKYGNMYLTVRDVYQGPTASK